MGDSNGVRITNREIFDAQRETDKKVDRLVNHVANLESKTEQMAKRLEAIEAVNPRQIDLTVNKLEGKTSALETRVYGILATVVAALLALSQTGVIG